MVRYAQLVLGPAGSGKSSYVTSMVSHGQALNRVINAINLDPAAEHFDYEPIVDIRELIHLEDIMADEDLQLGPNGGLIYAMEYLLDNTDWLEEQLGDFDNDYLIFDTAGQIELTTHLDIMHKLVRFLESKDIRVCAVFLLDSNFISDVSKFFSGLMVSLSAMVSLEVTVVNLFTKTDLLDKRAKSRIEMYLEPDSYLLDEDTVPHRWGQKYAKLTEAFGKLIDDYSLIKFMQMNVFDEDSLNDVLLAVDMALQFGEDQDVKVQDFDEPPVEGGNGMNSDHH